MVLFYISWMMASGRTQDADALYDDRANLASARQAADIWTRELRARPENFEVAWKLARVTYWLGTHGPAKERRGFLDHGLKAADTARALEPGRPEGHFWAAATMGALAEGHGLRAGLRYRKPIKAALETVLKLDPEYMNGSADRALGRWYHQVPGMFGGDHRLAEQHLQASLARDPNSTISHFFLAELLIDEGRTADAKKALETVIAVPINPEWGPEDSEYKRRARELLARMK